MKTWYCVTSKYSDYGVSAAITETIEASEMPTKGMELAESSQVWVDWFESLEEAEMFIVAMLEEL